ncbi:hypothetical protein QBC40DRAFT_8334 [Triangularia verruculosa]|uniref:C2H2-type domain-containing protein n=1 Tax=Triangularia verruculosa TaxID=2587418 RepID=A0AAN6XP69_9PEZI|nr:hypothetical protein QBC40DRAFT_8334 [Triangularia verruculosa]
MDFSSSQIPPSYQPPLKRSASHVSSDDDPPHQDQDEQSGDSIINTSQRKEWEDLSTSSIASVASEELHERRPNRWRGNPSTWRTWTKNERRTWESIENVRKADLSVHLYNAFALKKGVRKGPEERFLGGEGQNSGGWNVGSRWVAWPLPVHEVPGDDLLDLEADDGNGEFTFRRREGREKYPGRNLEEVVSATVLRLAKERFYRRVQRWKDESGEEKRDEADVMQSVEQGDDQDAVGDEEDEDSDMDVGHGTAAEEEDTNATGDAFAKGPRRTRLSTTMHSEATFTPVMSADDERNYALIRPSAKRIMSQLDKTLMVLHHARAAAARDIYGFDTDEDDDSEEEVENAEIRDSKMDVDERPVRRKARGRSRTRSRSRGGSRPARFRLRSRSRSNSSGSSGSRVSTKVSRIGLQNWRDVLGAAALAGFSPEVIARATQRCSNLFNEEMVMHTLPERAVTSEKPTVQTTRYRPNPFRVPSPLSDDDDCEYNEQLAAHRRSIRRQSTAASTQKSVNAPAPAAKRASTPAAPSRGRSATPGASSTGGGGPHLCPFIDCNRAVEGFSRSANLQRHIRLIHMTEPTAVQCTDAEQDTEDELTGAIHTDGFLQPIKIRKGWRGDNASKRERKVRRKNPSGSRDTDGDEDGGWESRSRSAE